MKQIERQAHEKVLEIAWRRQAEFDREASAASRWHLRLRSWVIILGVVATLFAILADNYGHLDPILGRFFKWTLIVTPIATSGVLAFANRVQQGENWLAWRTGSEEIKKEIYLYRTLLQDQPDRHHWLNERLATIQRQVAESVGDDSVTEPFTGPVPARHNPADPNSDPGFADLLAFDYLRFRLTDQLDWHTRQIERLRKQRLQIQIGIFAFSGLGTLLAALGANLGGTLSTLSIWVAFTTAIAAALTSWLELRRLDSTINNYGEVTLELNLIHDHWHSLTTEEQNGAEFFKLVAATERVLWSQHNQYINEMRQAVADLKSKDDDMVAQVMRKPVSPAIDEALLVQAGLREEEGQMVVVTTDDGEAVVMVAEHEPAPKQPKPRRGLPHAFVVMPFGQKEGPDGNWIDFNSIYADLIRPALLEAGFEPFRADEESVSGDILTDMFQELLLADLVIADLSIDNANVFYELGVRHAMRKRGVVHIQSGRSYMPFDIFNVRTIPYTTDKNGKPDPAQLDKDKQAIIKVARETWASDQERIHSPIFNLLDGLTEPDRRTLRTPLATGYWREFNEWQARVTVARRQKRLADILLLTEEVSNPLLQEQAIAEAGQALKSMGQYALALQQYRRGLVINPRNTSFQREEAFHLARLHQYDEAIIKLEGLLNKTPADIEAISYLGHIYKDMWTREWAAVEDNEARIQAAHEAAYLLKRAIDTYLSGYGLDQNHYYSGINALMLATVMDHLAGLCGEDDNPEVNAVRRQIPALQGAVQFSLEREAERETNDFWVFASLGDLSVCLADAPIQVTRAYKKAMALGGKSRFGLQSTLTQLELLQALNFRPDYVQAGIEVINETLSKLYEAAEDSGHDDPDHEHKVDPQQVFLFTGHMIDQPDRPRPRFPAEMEKEARKRVEVTLDKLNANDNDLAIAPGAACGGDILFIEACLARGMTVDVYLPFEEAKFIEASVSFAGDGWIERFHRIRLDPQVTFHLQPDRVGTVPKGQDPFSRNNHWAFFATLGYGAERVRLVALWDGQGGDGPGGTRHMVREVRRMGGIVEHLNTTKFDYWKAKGKVGAVLDELVLGE